MIQAEVEPELDVIRQKNPKVRNMWLALIHGERKERKSTPTAKAACCVSRLLTLDHTEVFSLSGWPQHMQNLPLATTHLVLHLFNELRSSNLQAIHNSVIQKATHHASFQTPPRAPSTVVGHRVLQIHRGHLSFILQYGRGFRVLFSIPFRNQGDCVT